MRALLLLLAACATSSDSGEPPPQDKPVPDATSPGSGDEASSADAGPPDRSNCPSDPDKIGLTTRTLQGAPKYIVYVPKTYDPNVPSSLIEALHGAGDNMANYIKLWEPVADQRNAIVLVPEASSSYSNGYTWLDADTKFILSEQGEVAKCYSIDPKRRILHGFSAGGIMAYWIGLAHADLFAGIVIFSADFGSAETLNGGSLLPSAWLIPVSHWHGMDDMNFPISYALASKQALEAAGHPFYWHPVPGGHTAPATIPNALQAYDDLASSMAP